MATVSAIMDSPWSGCGLWHSGSITILSTVNGDAMCGILGNLISDVLSHVLLKCSKMPNTSA